MNIHNQFFYPTKGYRIYMEVLFQAGGVLAFRSDIRIKLFPKVFLNPNGLRLQEHE